MKISNTHNYNYQTQRVSTSKYATGRSLTSVVEAIAHVPSTLPISGSTPRVGTTSGTTSGGAGGRQVAGQPGGTAPVHNAMQLHQSTPPTPAYGPSGSDTDGNCALHASSHALPDFRSLLGVQQGWFGSLGCQIG